MRAEAFAETSATPHEWLRKAEAAARLGISERTLDTRLARGDLQKRRKPGGPVEVLVPRLETEVRSLAATQLVDRYHSQLAEQLVPLLDLLERERAQLVRQAETIGHQAATIEQLQGRLAELDAARGGPARRWWRIWSRVVS